MKKQSRTVPRRRQSVSPTPRHLPLVDILIDTQGRAPGAGRRVWPEGARSHAGRGSGRRLWATVCASTCAPGVSNGAYAESGRAGRAEGGDSSAPCAARRRGGSVANGPGIRECGPAEPARGRPDADRCGDPPVCAESGTARRRRHHAGHEQECGQSDALSRRLRRSWMRGGRRRSTRWTWWGC